MTPLIIITQKKNTHRNVSKITKKKYFKTLLHYLKAATTAIAAEKNVHENLLKYQVPPFRNLLIIQ